MSVTTASAVSPAGAAADQLRALLTDGWSWVRHGRRRSWRTLVATLWAAGIAADAFTTITMMHLGVSEEGNAAAAAGMAVLSVPGYTALASALCAALAVMNTGRPKGVYAWTAWVTIAAIGALKVYIAAGNIILWASV